MYSSPYDGHIGFHEKQLTGSKAEMGHTTTQHGNLIRLSDYPSGKKTSAKNMKITKINTLIK
jgi:hypothetical protein